MATTRGIDLVLVNPGARSRIYQGLGKALTAVEPPVWAGLMATFVQLRGYSVAIVDANASDLTPNETAQQVQDMAPVLTAIVVYGHQPSASTQSMPGASAAATAIKQLAPDLKVLMVGGHVASLPERTLREEDVDYACGGEGLHTLVELLEALKTTAHPDLSKVHDLWYLDADDKVHAGPPAPLVQDVDQAMPGMAWDLLPMDKYRAHNWHAFDGLQREPYVAMYTTLGCPYHCTFCCIQAPFKSGEGVLGFALKVNTYRMWSVNSFMSQLDVIVQQYGVRNIKIADEMFVLNPKHVNDLCDAIIERGYDLNIWAYARVDTVRENMPDKLKKAGFNWLGFGVESANERVRKDVDKGFGQDLILRTLDRVQKAGIHIGANYIFGLPEDDMDTMEETLNLALELNTEWANFYCAMAYPGSDLYTQALKEGWPLPKEWAGYSQHAVDSLPLPSRHLSGQEILKFRDKAFNTYFEGPRYLDMIRSTFGQPTVDHVNDMTSIKLERELR